MAEKKVCAVCRTTGKQGAEWVAQVGSDRLHVHKPCGQRLAETAPDGVAVKLSPSQELRESWKQQARERQVRDFWKGKFASAGARAP